MLDQGNDPWFSGKDRGDTSHDEATAKKVMDRILAVLIGRSYFVVDNDICEASDLNWLTRMALGFKKGLLEIAADLGADEARNLRVRRDGGVAVVQVFRPEVKNALNSETMTEIAAAFGALAGEDDVQGVVLTSADGALAGADIGGLAALPDQDACRDMCLAGYKVLDIIESFPKPVVAAVDGPVLGGGAEISMACHARVVGRGLMLGQPEVNLGIIPGYGGTQRLPRLIGFERAMDLLRTARSVGAKEACEWGWAHGEPAENAVEAAKTLVKRHVSGEVKLAPVDPAPMEVPAVPDADIGHRSLAIDSILVDVCREGLARPLAEGLKVEADGFARCKGTVDMDIGMKNFMQNGPRTPAVFLHE
jgi:enoyl-CoA hydratase/carnithine racemase